MKDEKPIVSSATRPCNKILLAFASQTGQAESISELVADQLRAAIQESCQQTPLPEVIRKPLNLIELSEIQDQSDVTLPIFLVSTTGEGEPPENALKFWRKLRRLARGDKQQVEVTPLSHLKYSLLGLGDTNYNRFAAFGKDLNKLLLSLGASPLEDCPSDFADDAVGLELVVEPWIDSLLPAVLYSCGAFVSYTLPSVQVPVTINTYQVPLNMADIDVRLTTSSAQLSAKDSLVIPLIPSKASETKVHFDVPDDRCENFFFHKLSITDSPLWEAELQDIRLLTSHVPDMSEEDKKDVYEVTFKVDNEDFSYSPGDAFGVICGNHDEEVLELIRLILLPDHTNPTSMVKIASPMTHFPPYAISLFELIKFYCEIRAIIKKNALRHLSDFTSDPSEKRRLLELSSREGASEYSDLVRINHVSLLDVLRMFPSCKPPLDVVLIHLPPLVPRYYSVITSQLDGPKNVFKVVFSVTQFKKNNKFKRNKISSLGLFTGQIHLTQQESSSEDLSNLLDKLSLNIPSVKYSVKEKRLNIFRRKNVNFKLPEDIKTPLLLIGPGTGVAPFISFLTHRRAQIRRSPFARAGEVILVFTCRHPDHDFIYKNTLDEFVEDKTISHLIVGYTRAPPRPPLHVQDIITTDGRIQSFLSSPTKGKIYVCGDVKSMSVSVFNAFAVVVEKNFGADSSREEAVKHLRDLQAEKYYLEDIWV